MLQKELFKMHQKQLAIWSIIKPQTLQLSQTTIKLQGPCHEVIHALETKSVSKKRYIFSSKKAVNYRRADNNGISKDDKFVPQNTKSTI